MATSDDWGDGGSEQDFSFDGDAFGSEQLKGSSNAVDAEGWYHFEVADVKNELDTVSNSGQPKSPAICFHCAVMQSVPNQSPQGSMLFHRIYLGSKGGDAPAEGSVKSALRFGIGLGLLEIKEIDGREVTVIKGTTNTKIPASIWQKAKNMQFIAQIKKEKDTDRGKGRHAIPFGEVYQPTHPDVADVAMNKEALAMIGITVAAGGGAAGTPPKAAANGASAAKPAAVSTPAAGADDDLSDL